MASIGPVGNAIFANQQTAAVSSVQNAHNNRVDMQNMIAQAAANEKDEKVLEVRPTEENHKVDPDREDQQQESKKDNEKNENKEDEEASENTSAPLHKLDIKV